MPITSFPFRGRYEGHGFTVEDVISALSAQRLLIREAVEFLEELDPDFDATKVVIRVVAIEESSLIWDLLVEIWGTYQEQITEKVTGNIEKALDVDIPETMEPLVALAVVAVTYWGLRYAYDRVARRKTKDREAPLPPAVNIEGNYNTVVNIIADTAHSSPMQVEKALNEALHPQRMKIAKAATDFVRPAVLRGGDGMTVEGAPGFDRATIAEVPSDAELARTSEMVRLNIPAARLSIRGTDRDSQVTGWRALIEDDDRFPKRLPLILSPDVNPEQLADYPHIIGDVVVEGEQFLDGSYIARRIHLRGFTLPENSG